MKKIDILKIFKNKHLNKQNLRITTSFFLGILVTIIFCSFLNKNKMTIDLTPSEITTGEIAAKINDKNIYIDEVDQQLTEMGQTVQFKDLNPEDKRLIVKEIFVQKLVLKEALKNKSYKDYSEALKKFASQETKSNHLRIESKKYITEEEVMAKYQELFESIKDKKEYLVSHILTKTKAEAEKAYASLSNSSFEEAAQKFSIDDRSSSRGGDLGYILEGSTIKEFEEKIKQLKKDGISQPFKTSLGWHIIALKDTREVVPAKYEDVKDRIKDSMIDQGRKAYILNLVKDMNIEVF